MQRFLLRLNLFCVLGLTGCLSPIALDHAVIAYDKSVTDILSKQLLLNIARAHQHQPLHFTGVSNIAATFNFQFNAGATPALTGESGGMLLPVFGGSVSENPTISIVPIEGEEFTRRLLTPFQENKLTMLLRQGADVDLILRLLAGELHSHTAELNGIFLNKPKDKEGYTRFRQVVSHISSIQDNNQLFVEPLQFEQHWQLPSAGITPEQLLAMQKEFKLSYNPGDAYIQLSKHVIGRIVLTNYDPSLLSNAERQRLHEEADTNANNDIAIDIRSGFPGGNWPIRGFFRLRSFHNVLNFIGLSISDDPEYPVNKHPQTPSISENPTQTMQINVSEVEPEQAELNIFHAGKYYSLPPETGYPWNREGFRLLYQIFQMTITDLAQQGAPSITIAK